MDWYSLVKFLHIVSAVVWVGGGFALMLLALRGERANNIDVMLQSMRATGELGNRLFAPMSMLTFVFGFVMCWFWVGFSDLWVIIGLAGYLVTFTVGMTVFNGSFAGSRRISAGSCSIRHSETGRSCLARTDLADDRAGVCCACADGGPQCS